MCIKNSSSVRLTTSFCEPIAKGGSSEAFISLLSPVANASYAQLQLDGRALDGGADDDAPIWMVGGTRHGTHINTQQQPKCR